MMVGRTRGKRTHEKKGGHGLRGMCPHELGRKSNHGAGPRDFRLKPDRETLDRFLSGCQGKGRR